MGNTLNNVVVQTLTEYCLLKFAIVHCDSSVWFNSSEHLRTRALFEQTVL